MDNIVYGFETRRPVDAGDFANRTELLDQLRGLLETHRAGGRPSQVALLGPRKIGKTSVLRELQRCAPAQLTVFLDLFRLDTRPQAIFCALVRELLVVALRAIGEADLAAQMGLRTGLPTAAHLARAGQALPDELGAASAEALEALRRPDIESADIERALELPERFARELGPLWIVLDEVQELAALDRQRPFSKTHTVFRLMRAVWQGHSRVSYWVTGSQVSMLTSLLTDRRSPLHGHFRIVRLGPFDDGDADRLLLERVRPELLVDGSREGARAAAAALGNHPFYLQVLGEELELRRVPLTPAGVRSVLQDLALTPTGRLALHLDGVLEADAGRGQQRAVLRALAHTGEIGLAELVEANPSFSKASVHSMLRRLEKADLVVRDPDRSTFRVADVAMAAWLRAGGAAPEPAPAILGDEGERAAARELMAEGFRPVYASYRSLGPADLVSLEPKRRLAIQVKRTAAPIYVAESEWQRMAKWAEEQTMQPLLCRVDPDDGVLHWWEWQRAVRAGRRRRFDDRVSAPTAVELLRLS